MEKLVLIGLGGFVGAILRYQVSGFVQTTSRSASFPWGTLAVNLIGCMVIGFMTYLVSNKGAFSPELRTFVLIGLLGAFTTFSTFGQETVNLITRQEYFRAIMNLGANNILGIIAVLIGRFMASALWR